MAGCLMEQHGLWGQLAAAALHHKGCLRTLPHLSPPQQDRRHCGSVGDERYDIPCIRCVFLEGLEHITKLLMRPFLSKPTTTGTWAPEGRVTLHTLF